MIFPAMDTQVSTKYGWYGIGATLGPLLWNFGKQVRGQNYGSFMLALINHTECNKTVSIPVLTSALTTWPIRCLHWICYFTHRPELGPSRSLGWLLHPTGFAWGKIKTNAKLVRLNCWMAQVQASDWSGGKCRGMERDTACLITSLMARITIAENSSFVWFSNAPPCSRGRIWGKRGQTGLFNMGKAHSK